MNSKLDDFFDYVTQCGIFRRGGILGTPKKFRRYVERLFSGVAIEGRQVLDVGAGTGVFSAYLALKGARTVRALEPEAAGSQKEMARRFQAMLDRLGIANVTLENTTIQQLRPATGAYDLILLHNCINHFDEAACAKLHYEREARTAYEQIFHSLNQLTQLGGQIVLADVTRHNFFDRIGIRSPFSPSINWKIHQPPEVWRELAGRAGFACDSLRWTAFSHFGSWAHGLLANRVAAYFLLGHFSMVLRKVREVAND